MSLGYAERLSHREDLGGRLGDPELFDLPYAVLDKSLQLADLIRNANKVIAFTGAGISTSAGIPDFRGPNGVWTLQRKGEPLPKLHTSFVYAKPSLTHQALLGLMQAGKLDYICSQNVDSLHLRSGVPREKLAELHGNCFAERCKKCKTEYVRDFEMDTVGFKQTGRRCNKPGCNGMLVDHILDWEDALPPAELKATQQHASSADLAMCLGTSLQIIPAANLPLRTVKAGGKLAIINLQGTPKDKKAEVVIHAKVDEVLATIMQQVGIPIPVFTRTDRVVLSHTTSLGTHSPSSRSRAGSRDTSGTQPRNSSQQQLDSAVEVAQQAEANSMQEQLPQQQHLQQPADGTTDAANQQLFAAVAPTSPAATAGVTEAGAAEHADGNTGTGGDSPRIIDSSSASTWSFTFSIASMHGSSCPLPMVAAASVSFVGAAAEAGLECSELSGPLPWRLSRSCHARLQEVALQVTLHLIEAADVDKRTHVAHYVISRPQNQQQPNSSNTKAKATRRNSGLQQQQPEHSQVFSFITQQLDYAEKQQLLVQQLQSAAAESRTAVPPAETAEATAAKPRKRSASNSSSKRGAGSGPRQRDASAGSGRSTGVNSGSEGAKQQSTTEGNEGQGTGVKSVSTGHQKASVADSSSSENEGSSEQDGDAAADAGVDDSASEESDVEPTGQDGQNTTGRPRKRTKRLDL